jgi:hypothetical protein
MARQGESLLAKLFLVRSLIKATAHEKMKIPLQRKIEKNEFEFRMILLIVLLTCFGCMEFEGTKTGNTTLDQESIRGFRGGFSDAFRAVGCLVRWNEYKISENTEAVFNKRLEINDYIRKSLKEKAEYALSGTSRRSYYKLLSDLKNDEDNFTGSFPKWPIVMITKVIEKQNNRTIFISVLRYEDQGVEVACTVSCIGDSPNVNDALKEVKRFMEQFEKRTTFRILGFRALEKQILNNDGTLASEELKKEIKGFVSFLPLLRKGNGVTSQH